MTIVHDAKQLKDLSMYPIIVRENMRFRDTDANGHVNNAVYATYLELARGRARHHCLPPRPPGTAAVVGRQLINYIRELNYPGILDIGTGITNITRSTWTWGNAVFKDGICYATGEVTLVMISKATKRSAEIPRDIRHKLEALRLHKTDKPIILTADL